MEPTRRELVQMLGALGLSAAAIGDLPSQAQRALQAGDLEGCLAIHGRSLSDDNLEIVRRALQRNLAQFQAVRDLELDDAVAPATIFDPMRR